MLSSDVDGGYELLAALIDLIICLLLAGGHFEILIGGESLTVIRLNVDVAELLKRFNTL